MPTNGRIAADYLVARGHSRLAVLNTDPDYSAIAVRTDAFLDACRKETLKAEAINGRHKDMPAFLDEHPREDDVNRLVRHWVSMNPLPDRHLPAG